MTEFQHVYTVDCSSCQQCWHAVAWLVQASNVMTTQCNCILGPLLFLAVILEV